MLPFDCSMRFFVSLLTTVCFLSFLTVAITVRDKLESLCRELQRQNKMLMVCFLFSLLIYFGVPYQLSFAFEELTYCGVNWMFLCVTGRMQAGINWGTDIKIRFIDKVPGSNKGIWTHLFDVNVTQGFDLCWIEKFEHFATGTRSSEKEKYCVVSLFFLAK